MSDALLQSLRAAVGSNPDDVELRLHLAELLVAGGLGQEAIGHLGAVLAQVPDEVRAQQLMTRALAGDTLRPQPGPPASPAPPEPPPFDWQAAEEEVAGAVEPMFVDAVDVAPPVEAWDVERPVVRLDEVGGMQDVKARIDAAFLVPLRNPELRRAYGKSLRGGLLLYGPPGCGKTFLARAVAGELGAQFVNVGLADVLDMWYGNTERNVADVFRLARRSAPCVLFLDELDALGGKRSQSRTGGGRNVVNQLLLELDGVAESNEGVFVLAATNAPWDVDPALRRPGRLDRTVLVLPPDPDARAAILRFHLRDRPVAGVDVGRLVKRTEGFSGADLAHVVESATEVALLDSARSGSVRYVGQHDLETAVDEVRPSTGPWFDTARNVALFANEGGEYDELLRYMKKRRLA